MHRHPLLSSDVLSHPVTGDPDPQQLGTASSVLVADDPVEIGLWEAGPGEDTDVEVDEVFVVLAGSGTVTIAGGDPVELRPGVIVQLRAGDRTAWHLTERLRKLYVAWPRRATTEAGAR